MSKGSFSKADLTLISLCGRLCAKLMWKIVCKVYVEDCVQILDPSSVICVNTVLNRKCHCNTHTLLCVRGWVNLEMQLSLKLQIISPLSLGVTGNFFISHRVWMALNLQRIWWDNQMPFRSLSMNHFIAHVVAITVRSYYCLAAALVNALFAVTYDKEIFLG
jgi:hypothetical protein